MGPPGAATRGRTDRSEALSLTEWAVLGLLVEGPAHGFALARHLAPGSDLGRILTVRRPLVYRALDRLVAAGRVRADRPEPSRTGPARTLHRSTSAGTRTLNRWLATPVGHVRLLRVEFLVKLRLTERRQLDPGPLIAAQRAALAPTLDRLGDPDRVADVVERWRYHNARAVEAFLDDLADAATSPSRS